MGDGSDCSDGRMAVIAAIVMMVMVMVMMVVITVMVRVMVGQAVDGMLILVAEFFGLVDVFH